MEDLERVLITPQFQNKRFKKEYVIKNPILVSNLLKRLSAEFGFYFYTFILLYEIC